jgi:hypothetical protein
MTPQQGDFLQTSISLLAAAIAAIVTALLFSRKSKDVTAALQAMKESIDKEQLEMKGMLELFKNNMEEASISLDTLKNNLRRVEEDILEQGDTPSVAQDPTEGADHTPTALDPNSLRQQARELWFETQQKFVEQLQRIDGRTRAAFERHDQRDIRGALARVHGRAPKLVDLMGNSYDNYQRVRRRQSNISQEDVAILQSLRDDIAEWQPTDRSAFTALT